VRCGVSRVRPCTAAYLRHACAATRARRSLRILRFHSQVVVCPHLCPSRRTPTVAPSSPAPSCCTPGPVPVPGAAPRRSRRAPRPAQRLPTRRGEPACPAAARCVPPPPLVPPLASARPPPSSVRQSVRRRSGSAARRPRAARRGQRARGAAAQRSARRDARSISIRLRLSICIHSRRRPPPPQPPPLLLLRHAARFTAPRAGWVAPTRAPRR
jgi:hypothetical protein